MENQVAGRQARRHTKNGSAANFTCFGHKDIILAERLDCDSRELSRFFHEAISKNRDFTIHVFVDALDECEDDEVSQTVRNFGIYVHHSKESMSLIFKTKTPWE